MLKLNKVHILAAGGIGMSALVHLYLDLGMQVYGSDKKRTPLIEKLVEKGLIFINEDEPLPSGLDAVIYSTAILSHHPQLVEARKDGIATWHRSMALQSFMENKKALLVAGTHGKTTTSSLLTHVLKSLGENPSFALGGVLSNGSAHAAWTDGAYFVAEACESDGTFLNYTPHGVIITNIDDDHMDYWHTFEELKEGFKTFMQSVENKSLCVYQADDSALKQLDMPGTTYGIAPTATYCLVYDEPWGQERKFIFQTAQQLPYKGSILLNGHHNVQNALGVFALVHQLGFKAEAILESIKTFQGVNRRCEIKGVYKNALWIDDYGHHPNEIKATLAGIKQRYPGKSVAVIFQPHRFSRTKDLWHEFFQAFSIEDHLIFTDIYGAGEANPLGLSAACLATHVEKQLGRSVSYVPRGELFQQKLNADIVVTFGAGDITQLYQEVSSL